VKFLSDDEAPNYKLIDFQPTDSSATDRQATDCNCAERDGAGCNCAQRKPAYCKRASCQRTQSFCAGARASRFAIGELP
jgi:hypothetical protein